MNGSLPKHWASHMPKKSLEKIKHRVNTSSKASFGGAVKQQLFSPKQLHWQFLHPNSGPKTRNPTPVKISSTSAKHKAGTTPNISSWFSPTSRKVSKSICGHLLLGLDPAEALVDLTSSSWSHTGIPHPSRCCCMQNQASPLPPMEKWLKKGNHAFTPDKGLMVHDTWHLGVHPTSH